MEDVSRDDLDFIKHKFEDLGYSVSIFKVDAFGINLYTLHGELKQCADITISWSMVKPHVKKFICAEQISLIYHTLNN